MKIIFEGTGGWEPRTRKTPSVLLPDYKIALDAGTGMQYFEDYLKNGDSINVLLTHYHIDHIYSLCDLNYFPKGLNIRVYGPKGTKDFLENCFFGKLVPQFLEDHPQLIIIEDLVGEGELEISGLNVKYRTWWSHPVRPTAVLSFRIDNEKEGKSLSYIVDIPPSENTISFVSGSDALIHDCYLPEGYQKADALRNRLATTPFSVGNLAKKADVNHLYLTHPHKKAEEKGLLEKMLRQTRKIFPNTTMPTDGQEVEI